MQRFKETKSQVRQWIEDEGYLESGLQRPATASGYMRKGEGQRRGPGCRESMLEVRGLADVEKREKVRACEMCNMYIHIYKYAYQILTCKYQQQHANANLHTHTNTYIYTHISTYIHTCVLTHRHTRTHTNIHIQHTYTHTHTYIP